ncbi:hypothetical protein HY408_00885 [Candidatus Gottesmanbacteria bacterium]|nr:hypothetical protein [Candidatus Gottesmanbacteria bacterium]
MDQTQPQAPVSSQQPSLNKDELLAKAKELFAKAQYASPENLFLIDTIISSPDATAEDLQKVCETLKKHNQRHAEIFAEYKNKMQTAVGDYLKKSLEEGKQSGQPQTQPPVTPQSPGV